MVLGFQKVTGRSLLGISHSRWVLTPQPVKEVLPDHLRPLPAPDERGVSDRAVFLCSSSLDPPSNTLKVKLELLTVAQRACKIWLLLASPATLSHPSNCILPSHHPQPHRMKLPSPSACRDLPAQVHQKAGVTLCRQSLPTQLSGAGLPPQSPGRKAVPTTPGVPGREEGTLSGSSSRSGLSNRDAL